VTLADAEPEHVRLPSWLRVSRAHWRVYLIEGALLGLFMVSACAFGILLEHPHSPARRAIGSAMFRRTLMGLAMGATAVTLIYSRWGRRSGAHFNPATTLAFLRMRRIHPIDAIGYVAAQFLGGAAGVALVALLVPARVMHPSVNYVSTLPGMYGLTAAWWAEFLIAFVMLTVVMNVNKFPRLAPLTGCFAGLLVATYITFEAPISGMSLNPARTFASAVNARVFTFLWIYFTAPVLGMLAAVEVNRLVARAPEKLCGKFSHSRTVACIFKCNCIDQVRNDASGTS
jgi:aquaporin Z